MQGKNQIHINQSTMKDAVQLWLNDQFKNPPEVSEVVKNNDAQGAGADQFIIRIDSTVTPST